MEQAASHGIADLVAYIGTGGGAMLIGLGIAYQMYQHIIKPKDEAMGTFTTRAIEAMDKNIEALERLNQTISEHNGKMSTEHEQLKTQHAQLKGEVSKIAKG